MKIYLLLLIAFLSMTGYSQKSSIVIHRKNTEKTVTIEESKRIKVVTADGTEYRGRFKVIDSAHIMIEENVIPLDSIVEIRRKTNAAPLIIVGGVSCVLGGGFFALVGVALGVGEFVLAGGVYGALGIPMIIIPASPNNHPTDKNWEYAIKSNDKIGSFSNQIKVGQSERKEKSTDGIYE